MRNPTPILATLAALGPAALGVAALGLAAPVRAQEPLGEPTGGAAACGARLLEDVTADWLTATPVVGDFNLDGSPEAVVWGLSDGGLVVLIGRCAGEDVAEQWRFPVELEGSCDAGDAVVEPGSLQFPAAIVERVCAKGEQRDECIHLRRENERRRALDDAGGREVRIEAPGCAGMALVWSPELGGFMKMPR